MKLLAIETSSKICGTCLLDNNKIVDEMELDNGLTHSESLMPLINNLLKKHSLSISDLDAIICDIGPGSFTGIRIGVATAKAFIDSFENLKYSGVSSLEALAYNCTVNGLICSIIDAKNANCYFALYNLTNSNYIELIPPTATSISETFSILQPYNDSIITFVGDGVTSYKSIISQNLEKSIFLDATFNKIHTSNLALAGLNKISTKNTLDFSPIYLKQPQAQRQLEEKKKNQE